MAQADSHRQWMNRFDMSAVTRQGFTLTALGVEGHSAEGSSPKNQYAKSAIGHRYFNIAPKSFTCKKLRSAGAAATPEYSNVGQMISLSRS
jgi:hypothetical protein